VNCTAVFGSCTTAPGTPNMGVPVYVPVTPPATSFEAVGPWLSPRRK
jgi:hypothetical protein